MKYTIDKNFPCRTLTPRENALMDELSRYELQLNQGLFYQLLDILGHTSLVLSAEDKTRDFIPDSDEIKKELDEIDSIIDTLEKSMEENEEEEGNHPPVEKRSLIDALDRQRDELAEIHDSGICAPTPILGEFFPAEDKIVLYVNNIVNAGGNNPDTVRYLMAYVLLHECFHSFFHHAGIGENDFFPFAEEPMAEFGSLVMLDFIKKTINPASPFYYEVEETLNCATDTVQSKQSGKGLSAAYGFGYYLYGKKLHIYRYLLAKFANISNLIDPNCTEAKILKYLLYPTYPIFESLAYTYLEKLMDVSDGTTGMTASVLICKAKQSRIDQFRNETMAAIPGITTTRLDMITNLHFALQQYPKVGFTYRKLSDGSIRHAYGTTNYIFTDVPPTPAGGRFGNSRPPAKNQNYFDLDAGEYREFYKDNLISLDKPIRLIAI